MTLYLVRISIVFFATLLVSTASSGQHGVYINHLEEVNGTPVMPTGNPVQDELGFVWIPTEDGLQRYDGNVLELFRPDVKGTEAIAAPKFRGIYPSGDGKFYITSFYEGLYQFDPRNLTFESPRIANEEAAVVFRRITRMHQHVDGSWWLTGRGLFQWEPQNGTVKTFRTPSHAGYADNDITETQCIVADPRVPGILWLGSPKHIFRYEIANDRWTAIPVHADSEQGLVHQPTHLAFGPDGRLYVGTWYDGLHILDTADHTWEVRYVSGKKDSERLKNKVQWIGSGDDGELLVLSQYVGLFKYNIDRDEFELYIPHANSAGAAGPNYRFRGEPMGVMMAEDGALWMRRFPLGIEIVFPQQQRFRKVITESAVNKVMTIPGEDEVYLLTSSGVVQTYDLKSGETASFPVPQVDERNSIYSGSISPTSEPLLLGLNTFYTIDQEGVDRFPIAAFDSLQQVSDMFDNGHGRLHVFDQLGHLWIPLKRRGILEVFPSGKYELHSSEELLAATGVVWTFPQDIKVGSDGKLWFAFQQGVCITRDHGNSWFGFDFRSPVEQQSRFRNVSSMEEGSDGRMWLGTKNSGLFYVDVDQMKLHVYRDPERPHSLEIIDLERDRHGDLWMITGEGLSRMPAIDSVMDHFGVRDGLFALRSLTLLEDGRMAVAAGGGIYMFDPSSVTASQWSIAPVIHEFRVFGELQSADNTSSGMREVDLAHDQNFFSFEFSAPYFIETGAVEFQYQLEGIDKGWVEANELRVANYTDISPGDYRFRVRARTGFGEWSESRAGIELSIVPPWWKTAWAYAVYALLIAMLLYTMYSYQRRRYELKMKLQAEQNEALRLKELDAFKSRFFTNITHEFRTPLTVITGMADEISGQQKVRRMIHSNSRKLLNLVNQLLDLSKLEADQMKLDLVQADIIPYLEYLTESCHSLARDKHLNLSFYSKEPVLVMDFDEMVIQQIITNLVSNAIKFTPQYGSVKVIAERHPELPGWLRVTVKDTGKGIPKEKLEHIFDRFYQVDGSTIREGEGTGIGLAIVKELVKLMQGSITVESEVERGSVFQVELPISNQAQPADVTFTSASIIQEMGQKDELMDQESGRQIDGPIALVIEDNVDVIDYLRLCLEEQYQVMTARNGRLGVEMATEQIPDVIISDVMMPEMDGYEVCRTLKGDRRTSHIPIVILTAKATQEDKLKGLELGADAYLQKPFDKKELLIRLDNLTAISRKLRENLSSANGINDIAAKRESAFLTEVDGVISSHLADEAFDTAVLCKAVAMSRTQLHRKLKALTGQSTASYIRQKRLQEARSLLVKTDLPIGDIATKVGFKDFSHFSRTFSKEYGSAPSELRS